MSKTKDAILIKSGTKKQRKEAARRLSGLTYEDRSRGGKLAAQSRIERSGLTPSEYMRQVAQKRWKKKKKTKT